MEEYAQDLSFKDCLEHLKSQIDRSSLKPRKTGIGILEPLCIRLKQKEAQEAGLNTKYGSAFVYVGSCRYLCLQCIRAYNDSNSGKYGA